MLAANILDSPNAIPCLRKPVAMIDPMPQVDFDIRWRPDRDLVRRRPQPGRAAAPHRLIIEECLAFERTDAGLDLDHTWPRDDCRDLAIGPLEHGADDHLVAHGAKRLGHAAAVTAAPGGGNCWLPQSHGVTSGR